MKPFPRVNIRQRQYGFSLKDSAPHALATENVFVCTAWFGFDKINGIAFLCHFDFPSSVDDIPIIVAELKNLLPSSVDLSFDSYILNGSCLANSFHTKKTRKKILQYVRQIPIFKCDPIDLGYVKKGLRSAVVVDVKTFKWKRRDYSFHVFGGKVGAISKKMSKADGSA
jgi:hypothetical protein